MNGCARKIQRIYTIEALKNSWIIPPPYSLCEPSLYAKDSGTAFPICEAIEVLDGP